MNEQRFARWGTNIRKLRKSLKPPVSQGALAERIGVDQTTISAWERGEALIPDNRKLEISSALGVRPGRLFAWRDIPGSGYGNHEDRTAAPQAKA